MHKDRNPLSRHDNLVVQELDGEVLIYDLDDLRGALRPDAKGRSPRGDITAVRRLLQENAP